METSLEASSGLTMVPSPIGVSVFSYLLLCPGGADGEVCVVEPQFSNGAQSWRSRCVETAQRSYPWCVDVLVLTPLVRPSMVSWC